MKSLALIATLTLTAVPALAEPMRYELDPEHTTVAFLVEHVGYSRVLGRFNDVSGSFLYDAETDTLSDVTVTVETGSIDTDHEARDNHVRSKDFLNVAEYPQMVFNATTGTVTGEATGQVEGTLTLLGQTQPVILDVTLNKSEVYPFGHQRHTLGVSVRGSVLRSAFGMEYGIANGLVGDEVDLIVEFEALRAQ